MEVALDLKQFKILALRYQKARRKAKIDFKYYTQERSWRIKKRCK